MKIKGQSRDAQELRLIFGRCPIHGLIMCAVDYVQGEEEDEEIFIVQCPRRDCEMEGTSEEECSPICLNKHCRSKLGNVVATDERNSNTRGKK